MWKSESFDFMGLYVNILADVGFEYPDDARDWNRDKSHLQSILDQDGQGFFTLTLPAAGKHLDRCLSNGFLTPSRLAHFRAFRRGGAIPRLFRVLYLRIFEENGILRSSPEIGAIRFLRQLLYAAKKVKVPCAKTANYSAVQAFWTVEKALRPHTRSWDSDLLSCDGARLHLGDGLHLRKGKCRGLQRSIAEDPREQQPVLGGIYHHESVSSPLLEPVIRRLQQVADFIVCRLGDFDPLVFRPKHGPGAVADLRGKADKYSFPHWPAKLEGVFGCADFAYANYRIALDSGVVGRAKLGEDPEFGPALSAHEPPALLHAVPKSQKAPRLIACEPTGYMWCQQVIKDYLDDSVRHSLLSGCIDFRRQSLSQSAALRASHSGQFATVDLSEASDRISCWLVERLFRSREDLLVAFHAVRTRWLKQSLDKKVPGFLKLRKFSTMGSALTFPVQSIVFTMVAVAVRLHNANRHVDSKSMAWAVKEVRIFGDDIVCRSEDLELLTEVLSYLGLKVNADKTYKNGKFRESCGVDAYDGVDVTPAYVVEVGNVAHPNVVAARVDTSNNFHMKGYWRTASWLVSTLTEQVTKNLPVLPPHVGGLSLSSFCGRSLDHLKKRWNDGLQKFEYKHIMSRSKGTVCMRHSPTSLLQYFTERPLADVLGVLPEHPLGVQGRPKVHLHLGWGSLEF